MEWLSTIVDCGPIVFPDFIGVRILMMPIRLDDLGGTLPAALDSWRPAVERMRDAGPCGHGVGYLTIDERHVFAGAHHRRPGLHVDGWGNDGGGTWGGGWGGRERGMIVAANICGSVAYAQSFSGEPAEYGDCECLRPQCRHDARVLLEAGRMYCLAGLSVHETIPVREPCHRQFVRLSMPSMAGWPISNTPNPLGVLPTGPILPPRPSEFTSYQPHSSPSFLVSH